MALASTQVADAAKALLLGTTLAGNSVFKGRHWPIAEDALPALRVMQGDEDVNTDDVTWPKLYQHELDLEIEVLVRNVTDIDTALDLLAADVIEALLGTEADAYLQPLPNCELELRGISRLPASEGQAATGRALVRLLARFQTASNDPHTLV